MTRREKLAWQIYCTWAKHDINTDDCSGWYQTDCIKVVLLCVDGDTGQARDAMIDQEWLGTGGRPANARGVAARMIREIRATAEKMRLACKPKEKP
jgi:hypothetical protein